MTAVMNVKFDETLLKKDSLYVVGVSGGCDSMALLDILRQQDYKVLVAHVNYNFRHDTDIDYKVVSEYCEKYNIQFFYKQFCKDDYETGNFQDRARELRYEFYLSIYNMYDCDGVVLGHHLDDHLESIYMQLDKYNTAHYLGIRRRSIVKGMNIIRPLRDSYKSDILDYCMMNGIEYHDDYTNFQADFFRDKVRNTVLNQYSIKDKEKLLRRAEEHNQRIKEEEKKVLPYYLKYNKNKRINYKDIPGYLRNMFLYLILVDVMSAQSISYSLIEEINRQIESDKPNIQMNLPVNYLFIKEYDNIYIVDNTKVEGYCYVFDKYDSFVCDYFHLSNDGHMNEGVFLSEGDYPITIRTMKAGDSIITSSGTKKLSRLFINAKVPALKRKTWPVVLNSNKTIILVPHIAKNIDYLTTKPNVFVIK